ncbi:MAG: methyltransferase domain-containing protein [Betaproteobacteria bacterium]|nr:methyltransferase domain-containing protein [Betaproteobacteria bacterium]
MNESTPNRVALSRRRLLGAGFMMWLAAPTARGDDLPRTAGPYVPTPNVIVERMLEFAKVGPDDFVVDLGSGDGRMVRTAAKVYGASGFGVDINPALVEKSNAQAREEGIAERAVFYQQDVFKADIHKATVITLYVLPAMMLGLRPKFLTELRPGTRIVSHDYHFREWQPDSRWSFDVPEKREAVGFSSAHIYLWIVPAHVAGRWRIEIVGHKLPAPVAVELRQTFQQVRGTALVGTRSTELTNVKLRGDAFEFTLDATTGADSELHTYRGKVAGTAMEGDVAWGSGALARRYKWKAIRVRAPREPLAQ